MPYPKNPSQFVDVVTREGIISSCEAFEDALTGRAGAGASRVVGEWFLLSGNFTDAAEGATDFSIEVFPPGEPRVPQSPVSAVGSILRFAPRMLVVLELPAREYFALLKQMSSRSVRTCKLTYTVPQLGYSLVLSANFDS